MRSVGVSASALAVVLVVAGCGGGVSGSPEPTEDAEPGMGEQGGLELPHSGAPAVEDPIDVEPFLEEPCATIDAESLAEAGYDIDEADPDTGAALGPVCDWVFATWEDGSFGASIITASEQGVSVHYSRQDELDLFEVLDSIEGHPVVARSESDARDSGYCTVSVGLRDDLTYTLSLSASHDDGAYHDEPCDTAHELAELAVETMRQGDQ